MVDSRAGSKYDPWVLSDSDSEPDLSLDIHFIKPNSNNTNSAASTSKSTLASRTNSQSKSQRNLSVPSSSRKNTAPFIKSEPQTRKKSDDDIQFLGRANSTNQDQGGSSSGSNPVPIDTSGFVRLSTFRTAVVGATYYPEGSAAPGEQITFTREPGNAYDFNAVEVRARGVKMGHLGKDEARKFAPLMDAGKVVLEGYILERHYGGNGKPKIVMDIKGRESDKSELEGPLRFTTISWSGFSAANSLQPNAKAVMESTPAVRAAVNSAPHPPPSQTPAGAAASPLAAPNELFGIVAATYHCYLRDAQHYKVDLPSGSPLIVELNPWSYGGSEYRFLNQRRELAGLFPVDTALKLNPLLDQGKVQLEAFMKTGVKAQDQHRLAGVDIKCRASEYEALKPQLQYFIDLSGSMGLGRTSAAAIAASFARSARLIEAGNASADSPRNTAYDAIFGAADMFARRAEGFDDLEDVMAGYMGRRSPRPAYVDPDADLQEEDEVPQDRGPAPGAEMQALLGQMVAGTYRGADALASLYGEEGSVELADLPLHPNPGHWHQRGIIANLRSHQSQGVAWMQRKEHRQAPGLGDSQECLWQARKLKGGGVFWRNIASRPDIGYVRKSRNPPELMKGGILADAMGLGKTLTVLALALSDPSAREVIEEDRQNKEDKENGIVRDKKSEIRAKDAEDSKVKAKTSSSASDPKSEDLKPSSQEAKKATMAERTPSSSSNSSSSGGPGVKKRGLILPSPPIRIPETDEEDSQTEDEEDVKPKFSGGKRFASKKPAGSDEEDVKPSLPRASKKKVPRAASDSEEDVKPKSRTRQSKTKMIDSDSDYNEEAPVKGKGKGKARKLDTDSEEDVKPKKDSAPKTQKPMSKKKKAAAPTSEEDEMDVDEEYTESNLIVCPLSVLHNWESQINEHTDRSMVNYAVFHGRSATKLRYSDLSKYKFVLTTYDQIKAEHKFTEKKNAIRTENLRHTEALEDIEEALEDAKGRLEDASSRGERELAQKEIEDAKNSLVTENKLHERNMLQAAKTKGRGGASKKKVDVGTENDDDDSLFSASEDEKNYEKIKAKNLKADQKRADEIVESSIFTMKWRRIVLDEAHTIRNAKTAVFKAASDIQADRRWCATGTPIVNKTLDLGSLCYFLGLDPFNSEEPKLWNKLVELPIKKENNAGYLLLKHVVQTAVLRRTKNMTNEDGTRIVDLPPLEKYHHTVELDPETRQFYHEVQASIQTRVTDWSDRDELARNVGIMLVFLTRLRQICNDKSLVPANFLDDVRNRDFAEPIMDAGSKLTADQIAGLQEKLRAVLEAGEDCPVCMEALQGKEPRITTCSHAFCKACIEEVIKTSAKCPMDRNAITMGSLVELPPEILKGEEEETPEPEQPPEDRSAKANMLVKIIKAIRQSAPERKSLIFSSYTSYLDKVAVRLRKENIPICRFDGRMSRARRDAVLDSFQRPMPVVEGEAVPAPAPVVPAPAAHKRSGSSILDALEMQEEKGAFNAPAPEARRKTKPIPRGYARAEKERRQRDEDGAGPEIPLVMLISMGAGSVGLNLTAASNVFLMDPHWNTALEDQAIDRAHRIGQERTVKVFHIIAEDTVENRILEIQAQKEDLVLQAFKGVTNRGAAIEQERIRNETRGIGGAGRAGVDDMIRMFGLDPTTLRRRHNRH